MASLVLHPVTDQQLRSFEDESTHAVLLTGPIGSGKGTVARQLAAHLLQIKDNHLVDFPYFKLISPVDDKAITIEAVRELERFNSLKVPGDKLISRLIIIEDAHKLGREAQNALLKTLEEPPVGTVLILTATSSEALLPTIRSRVAVIDIKRPGRLQQAAFFAGEDHSEAAIQRALSVSGGLPGLVSALLNNTEHPLLPATEAARRLLGQSTYERLTTIDELAKQRGLALDTMFILQQMAHVSLQQAEGSAADRWQKVLTGSYKAAEALAGSAQPKLVLTALMLNLS